MRTRLLALLVFIAATTAVAQQSGNDLFQKALSKERAEGQLDEAIQIYERIVKEFAADRPLAAKALLQMGRCYERLGKSDAQKSYERLVREYGDQRATADEARARLVALGRARLDARPAPPAGIVTRQVWKANSGLGTMTRLGNVSPDGRYIFFADPKIGLALHDLSEAESKDRVVLPRPSGGDREGPGALWSVFAPNGRTVAFAWYNGSRYDLRAIGVDGNGAENPRVLYANDDIDWIGPYDWSADGKWIAVQLQRRDRTAQVGLVPADGGALRVLKSLEWQGSTNLSFSPDGQYLAFDLPSMDGTGPRDIFLLATDGSRQTPVAIDPSNDLVVGWTPDGKHLVFTSDRSGSAGLWSLAIQGGKPQGSPTLIKPDLGRGHLLLGLTRSGALYFLTRTGSSVLSIASVDFESGQLLTSAPVEQIIGGSSPAWSPDGKYLAYVPSMGKTTALGAAYRKDDLVTVAIRTLDTGQTRELHPQLVYFSAPRWSPDGRSFIGQGADGKGREGIFRIDVQAGRADAVFLSMAADEALFMPQWLPDGKRIVYAHSSLRLQGAKTVIVRDLASGAEREILRGNLQPHAVSPDGRYVACSSYDRATGHSKVMLLRVDGGEPRELLRVENPPRILKLEGWTPDSRFLVFVRGRLDVVPYQMEPWLLPVDGGAPRRLDLNTSAADYTQVHPDGKRVVFQVPNQSPSQMWVLENFLPVSKATSVGRSEVKR